MASIIDKSYNKETNELEQFTVIRDNGEPDLVKATTENVLLWDPENALPFEDGLQGFLSGGEALVFSEEDPEVIVAPTNNEYCYLLRVRENTVETTPKQAERALLAIKDASIDGDVSGLIDLYDHIMSTQVRRGVIDVLMGTFEEQDRISKIGRGWLVDDFYLVNWQASMYARHDDPDEKDVKRGGGGVTTVDKSYEFVQLNLRRDIEPVEVQIGGETFRLTEREMLFLAKIKWLLGRREYHPDRPFWMFADKRAAVDFETGEPIETEDDSPDPDNFNL